MKLSSFNEWDPLLEVVVGSADGTHAVLTWAHPSPIPPDVRERALGIFRRAHPEWLMSEIAEDLDGLSRTLESAGVRVFRPTVPDIQRFVATPYWESTGNNSYNVRDLHLVVGNTLVESPSYLPSRIFESYSLYDIWYDYLQQGFRWISAPKPRLHTNVSVPYFRDGEERILTDEDMRFMELTAGRLEELHRLAESEIVFEAANTLRMGRDLLYLVSSSGNWLGARWLQSILGEDFRVHATEGIYRSSHIDSTLLCLRPGLVLMNSRRVTPQNCPSLFDGWDKIWFEDVAPVTDDELSLQRDLRDPLADELEALGFQTTLRDMSSPWVGMNVLSIDPETVVVDQRQTSLMRELEKWGLTCVPVRMRHIYTQGGGIHCATLDTVREGSLESYFE